MVNLKELEKIVSVATNDPKRIAHNKDYPVRPYDVIELTDNMIDIIDYLIERQDNMRLNYPAFSDKFGLWFSYNNKLYRVVIINNNISIGLNSWLNEYMEEDPHYSFNEFLNDYFSSGYYYLDLDNMVVRSLWDNKTYSVRKDMGQ